MGRLDFEGANGSTRLDFERKWVGSILREQMGRLDSILGSKWVDSILREQMGRLDSILRENGSTRF